MAQKILPPEGGIDPPGRSDPEVEGRWKLLDRLPNEADRQGLRGLVGSWDVADVVIITFLEPRMPSSHSHLVFSSVPVVVRRGSEKGMLWLAVRALELCVQPAHTDTLAGPMRLVTTLPDGLCGFAPALPLRSLQVAMMTCQPSQST